MASVVFPIRVMALLGIERIISEFYFISCGTIVGCARVDVR